jgi:uncharacterized SAM-binding protein YcdF (DUF218 family)
VDGIYSRNAGIPITVAHSDCVPILLARQDGGMVAALHGDRALANGISPGSILLEERAINFGENIAFVRDLLPDLKRATFITKPCAVLRVVLTIPIQWPGLTAFVDSPPHSFPEEVSNVIGVLGVIHEMVGDIDRVIQYPSRGFQVPHRLPPQVLESWRALIAEGFVQHMLDKLPLK